MTQRPANYDQLSEIGKAIVDDHIREGITPPPMTPPTPQVVTHVWNSPIDDD